MSAPRVRTPVADALFSRLAASTPPKGRFDDQALVEQVRKLERFRAEFVGEADLDELRQAEAHAPGGRPC